MYLMEPIDYSIYTSKWVEDTDVYFIQEERERASFQLIREGLKYSCAIGEDKEELKKQIDKLCRLVDYLDKAIESKQPPDLSKYTDSWFKNATLEELEKENDKFYNQMKSSKIADTEDWNSPYMERCIEVINKFTMWLWKKRVPRHKRPFLDENDE